MKQKYLVLISLLFSVFLGFSQENLDPKFGKGMVNFVAKDSSFSVRFAPRMQFLTTTNWKYDGQQFGKSTTAFLLRRARLKFDGFAYSPKLKYKLELGLSNRDISGATIYTGNAPRYILDAVIKWNFYKKMVLWVGQTKLPGNRERVISSANLQLVDRSILNSNFNIDRDLGIQFRHHFKLSNNFIIREIVSVAQGEGRNIVTGNLGGFQYTSRLELLPFGKFKSKGDYKGSALERETAPKLAFGIAFDFNNNAVKTKSNMGTYMETDAGFFETNISTLFIDAILKYNGFSFMAEYAHRDAENPIAKNLDGTETGDVVEEGTGINLQTGYLFKRNWEISGRFSSVKLINKNTSNQYTFGVSKYIVGHKLKVQTDINYLTNAGFNNILLYRLQFDIHF